MDTVPHLYHAMGTGGSPDSVLAYSAPDALPSGDPLPLSATATGGGRWTDAHLCGPSPRELLPSSPPLPLRPRPVPQATPPLPPQPPCSPPQPSATWPPLSPPSSPPSPSSGSTEAVCDATAGDALFSGAAARSLQASPMAREWLLGEAWGDAGRRSSPPMTALGVRAAALFTINIFSAGGRGLEDDPRIPTPPGCGGVAVMPRDVLIDDDNVQFKYNSLVRARGRSEKDGSTTEQELSAFLNVCRCPDWWNLMYLTWHVSRMILALVLTRQLALTSRICSAVRPYL